MATLAYLDTHVLAWLYAGRIDLLPDLAREIIERSTLLISPMVELELQYLFEIGRVREPAESVCGTLAAKLDIRTCSLSFSSVVKEALNQVWTRDPFDRLITAQASLGRAPLVTKDATIQSHYALAIWNSPPTDA